MENENLILIFLFFISLLSLGISFLNSSRISEQDYYLSASYFNKSEILQQTEDSNRYLYEQLNTIVNETNQDISILKTQNALNSYEINNSLTLFNNQPKFTINNLRMLGVKRNITISFLSGFTVAYKNASLARLNEVFFCNNFIETNTTPDIMVFTTEVLNNSFICGKDLNKTQFCGCNAWGNPDRIFLNPSCNDAIIHEVGHYFQLDDLDGKNATEATIMPSSIWTVRDLKRYLREC
jgi:hypothetical protein